ncbi:MAG: hypothetical protein JW769_01105 [Parachlamydiales bacterium]|nr:hypothetical protein [Parachlamydiales bacterium]
MSKVYAHEVLGSSSGSNGGKIVTQEFSYGDVLKELASLVRNYTKMNVTSSQTMKDYMNEQLQFMGDSCKNILSGGNWQMWEGVIGGLFGIAGAGMALAGSAKLAGTLGEKASALKNEAIIPNVEEEEGFGSSCSLQQMNGPEETPPPFDTEESIPLEKTSEEDMILSVGREPEGEGLQTEDSEGISEEKASIDDSEDLENPSQAAHDNMNATKAHEDQISKEKEIENRYAKDISKWQNIIGGAPLISQVGQLVGKAVCAGPESKAESDKTFNQTASNAQGQGYQTANDINKNTTGDRTSTAQLTDKLLSTIIASSQMRG